MPLRIAHVANEAFGLDTATGVQHVVYCVAHAQAEIGELVAVFTRDDHAVHVLGKGGDSPRRSSATAVGPDKTLRQRLLSRYFEPALADKLLAWQPDLVHFHSVHIPQNVALAACLTRAGIPYCVTIHGGLFRAALRRGRLKKTLFSWLFELRYLNDARFIHAVSPHEIDAIRRYGVNAPVVVVPNGLPPDASVRALRPAALYEAHPSLRGRRIFIFIGRLDPWQKGLDLLIDALAQARLGEAALVLVGPDYRGSRDALRMLAERSNVSSEVLFLAPAFGQDRANLFAAADVFVHPSRWEGLSLSVLAAAAAGKPALITRAADPLGKLEAASAAIIVDPTASSVADGLRRAAALSAQELQEMGARARSVAEAHFTWPSTARRLIDAYRSAIEDARRVRGEAAERRATAL